MALPVFVDTVRDFEVIWVNLETKELRDLINPTIEVVHFESSANASLISTNAEPFVLQDTVNNTLTFTVSGQPSESFSILASEASGGVVGCPAHSFTIMGTGSRMAVVNGNLAVALSACEISSLINSHASSVTSSVTSDGKIKLTSNFPGSVTLTVGNGNMNSLLGFTNGQTALGSDIQEIFDIFPTLMTRISLGKYAFSVDLNANDYIINKRYFVRYRGIDPIFFSNELLEESFTVIENGSSSTSSSSGTCCGINVSFC